MKSSPKIILGIDPGTVVMGYAVLAVKGNEMELLTMDVLKLVSEKDTYRRLEMIYSKVSGLIELYRPTMFAVEAPFFGKNVQSMLKLGRAQGVAIAAAMSAGLEVFEYSPKKIKQSITGNGNAGKEQVWQMLQRIMSIQKYTDIKYLDASDALAVAVCHHFQDAVPIKATGKKLKGWEDFIAKNPERVGQKKL